ncbi:type II toxin-antitoxin system HicB family antitoxin [Adlercreutzia sp. R25]|uniref:type II toxin-antitoxin system HicB family antitoxin n=1 Tax=Adlercreutzia shanghongiae TaxID=3111773 RepID=UPI002DB81F00|nr:type II toxin-antitoxin system HicB family antitoxin [Adlercreutzia sp. R25]MEC4272263.1 type II toxin-antitoxin system HicB family antitoxin [Adlercreutzia sp. R25]
MMVKKPERYFYPAVFSYAEGEDIAVVFPDLDVATSGANEDDALLSARELLGCVMFGLEEEGECIPQPTPLNELCLAAGEKTVLVDAYMPSVRQAQSTKAVNRTVTLPAWLNALAAEHGINFSQTLQVALRQQLGV